ncbi:hypothetical protein HanIR_Chr14g0682121 [Helianthus annuus]|nr:hypothetical protein HanIR_Chr14g0682121 [Helianthus annuus]
MTLLLMSKLLQRYHSHYRIGANCLSKVTKQIQISQHQVRS